MHVPRPGTLGRRLFFGVVLVAAGIGAAVFGSGAASDAALVSVSTRIGATAADAEERSSGTMRLSSDDLELTVDDSVQTVGLRFDDLAVPPGARIVEAYIEFVVDRSSVGASSLRMTAETSDEPADFTNRIGDLSTRPRTEIEVKWAPGPWLPQDINQVKRTPELHSLVQAIVDRPAWSDGDPMVFLIDGVGARAAKSFDGDPAGAPSLTVVYEPTDNRPPAVTISEPDGATDLPVDGIVELRAEAVDPEEGDISSRVLWTSSLDGQLGSGGTLNARLSAGPHVITAVAYDLVDRGASASVEVVLEPVDPVVLAGGEVASCLGDGDSLTASIVEQLPWATVLALGDQAYPDGTAAEYRDCFDETWGRFRDRIRAVPGNRDYHTEDAQGFYSYFDERSGEAGSGWYSFELGSWRVIAVNTNCDAVGGCGRASPQLLWLADELAANPTACTLVYGHEARFGSGRRGGKDDLADIWDLLTRHNVDIVLAGHDRTYERTAPLGADGEPDADGIRQFVVGTGGGDPERAVSAGDDGIFGEVGRVGTSSTNDDGRPLVAGSEVFDATSRGLLQLTLSDGSYSWTFLPADRAPLRDRGEEACNTTIGTQPGPVRIEIDSQGGPVPAGATASLTAGVFDSTATDLSSSIRWSSNRDGDLGTGESIALETLSPGEHVIVAEIAESTGLYGADSVEVEVLTAGGDSVETVTAAPNRSQDDAEEEIDTGIVSLQSSDLELSDERRPQLIGIRFDNLAVPADATIVRATVQFTAASVEVFSATADLTIHGDATFGRSFTDNPRNLSSRALTRAAVDWSPPWWDDPGDAGADQRTPDLAPVIQEMIDRPGWDEGDAVALIISGSGSRTAGSFDAGRAVRPVLEVEFVRGATVSQP